MSDDLRNLPRRNARHQAMAANSFDLRQEWLAKTREEAIFPEWPIIDPHHHLWDRSWSYLLDDLLDDIQSGHDVKATVYVQATSMYRRNARSGWESLGETEFANGVAAMAASGTYGEIDACAGIVGYVDLTRGSEVALILERHIAAAGDRLKGIRNSTVWDVDSRIVSTRKAPPKGLLGERIFRAGFALLEGHGLSFDAWLYHPQIPELLELARSFPGTTIILDHVGVPLGIFDYARRRSEVFKTWRASIEALSECANVNVKLGGLGMPLMGFGFETVQKPLGSDDLAEAFTPYFDVCIGAFGSKRCMFESNFPVDKQSFPYAVLWNAFKKYASKYSGAEIHDLFYATAARVYRLQAFQS